MHHFKCALYSKIFLVHLRIAMSIDNRLFGNRNRYPPSALNVGIGMESGLVRRHRRQAVTRTGLHGSHLHPKLSKHRPTDASVTCTQCGMSSTCRAYLGIMASGLFAPWVYRNRFRKSQIGLGGKCQRGQGEKKERWQKKQFLSLTFIQEPRKNGNGTARQLDWKRPVSLFKLKPAFSGLCSDSKYLGM